MKQSFSRLTPDMTSNAGMMYSRMTNRFTTGAFRGAAAKRPSFFFLPVSPAGLDRTGGSLGVKFDWSTVFPSETALSSLRSRACTVGRAR